MEDEQWRMDSRGSNAHQLLHERFDKRMIISKAVRADTQLLFQIQAVSGSGKGGFVAEI